MSYEFSRRKLAEIIYSALLEDPFYETMERSVAGTGWHRKTAMLRYLDYSMKDAQRHGVLCVPEGDPFGVSVWTKPLDAATREKASTEKKAFLSRHMGRGSLATYLRITGFMSARSTDLVPPDSWYLSIIAVSPDMQGRGLGPRLVQVVLEQADEAGVPTYLETFTPRNKSFYRRLGYEETAVVLEPTTASEYSLMIRQPA